MKDAERFEIIDRKTRDSDLGDDYRTYPNESAAQKQARELERIWEIPEGSLAVRRVPR